MEYITIFQNNHKDQTHDVYFCEWNEIRKTELLDVLEAMTEFEDKFEGDYGEGYSFSYNLTPIPESAVASLSGIYTTGRTGVEFNTNNDKTPKSKKNYNQFLEFIRLTLNNYLRCQHDCC